MKILIALFFSLLIIYSCSGGVTKDGIDKAEKLCKDHGGINNLESFLLTDSDNSIVYCKDGVVFKAWYNYKK
jgi:hypothetical protein